MLCQDMRKDFPDLSLHCLSRQFRNFCFKPLFCGIYATKDLLLYLQHSEHCFLPRQLFIYQRSLWYTDDQIIWLLFSWPKKKNSKGRSLGAQLQCESVFVLFCFWSLEILYFQKQLPSYCLAVVLAALHPLSQIYFLGIPSGHLRLFTDELFQACDLQWPLNFLFSEFPALFISNCSEKTEAILANFLSPQPPPSPGQQICSMLTLSSSFILSQSQEAVSFMASMIIFVDVTLIPFPLISLGNSSHIFNLIFNLRSK